MTSWKIVYTKQAQKDAKKLSSAGFKQKTEKLLEILKVNPFKNPPEYEKLVGDLTRAYSRRINIQHRLIYQVYLKEKTIKVIRMWTHYE
ncbi:MAG: toxin of toxin-antitoxin system [Gammaproteobacteria bacterium RIFCSPHIGHO2_12_FULL_41_20]|nr:MAG: toxin of toxin-antitoxin system [Gammaproteobacteria bacterium RIFCSPHIGHO2_12_FULL_41_20]